jgi:hypothetical protein
MEKKKKREWVQPELIVLVRGKPEEGILQICKTGLEVGQSGPAHEALACSVYTCDAFCNEPADS